MANQPQLFKRVGASMSKEGQGTFLDGGDGGKLSTLDSRVNPTPPPGHQWGRSEVRCKNNVITL